MHLLSQYGSHSVWGAKMFLYVCFSLCHSTASYIFHLVFHLNDIRRKNCSFSLECRRTPCNNFGSCESRPSVLLHLQPLKDVHHLTSPVRQYHRHEEEEGEDTKWAFGCLLLLENETSRGQVDYHNGGHFHCKMSFCYHLLEIHNLHILTNKE